MPETLQGMWHTAILPVRLTTTLVKTTKIMLNFQAHFQKGFKNCCLLQFI